MLNWKLSLECWDCGTWIHASAQGPHRQVMTITPEGWEIRFLCPACEATQTLCLGRPIRGNDDTMGIVPKRSKEGE